MLSTYNSIPNYLFNFNILIINYLFQLNGYDKQRNIYQNGSLLSK